MATSHCLTKRHCIRICRLATPNSRRCADWRARDYLDTVLDGDPRCSQGDEPVTFQGMVDRIYYSTDTLELRDPVLQRTIIVAKQGAAQTVVWNPGEQAGNAIGDLSDGEWRGFVCVEAVNNRDCAVVVPPHDSHTLQQTLSVKH